MFSDALTLDTPRRTADGYLAVRAKAARCGTYTYTGAEIDPDNAHGLRDKANVNVLRDANTVFDTAAVRSFIGKPITDDHPSEAVTAANWRDHARGAVMGAMRDGDHLAFDLVLMDAATIAKVEAGKAELSNGYQAGLEYGNFTAPDGTVCDARQISIIGNHVAIVDKGRAGSTCRIGDAATCASIPLPNLNDQEKTVKIRIGDAEVDATNGEAVRVAVDALNVKLADANGTIAARDKIISTMTGEKVALEKQVADAKAELDPAKMQQRVADRAKLIADAKKLEPKITTDAVSDADVRRAVVVGRLGEAAKGLDDSGIAGAFITMLSAEDSGSNVRPLGNPAIVTDAYTEYQTDRAKQRRALSDAWRKPFTAADAADAA